VIILTAWNRPKVVPEASKPKIDPLRIARYYQSLLDTGKFKSRAAFARHRGVSRARVTQVLSRLQDATETTHSVQSDLHIAPLESAAG
jgi:hypothetical protein